MLNFGANQGSQQSSWGAKIAIHQFIYLFNKIDREPSICRALSIKEYLKHASYPQISHLEGEIDL